MKFSHVLLNLKTTNTKLFTLNCALYYLEFIKWKLENSIWNDWCWWFRWTSWSVTWRAGYISKFNSCMYFIFYIIICFLEEYFTYNKTDDQY